MNGVGERAFQRAATRVLVSTTVVQPDEAEAEKLGVTVVRPITNVTTQALDELRELVESDVVKPYVGKVFSLDEVQAAFTGSVKSKVILSIKK